jgi:hypothetical protein
MKFIPTLSYVQIGSWNQSNLIHALNSTGIDHAFNTHQYSRYQYARNDTVNEQLSTILNKLILKLYAIMHANTKTLK